MKLLDFAIIRLTFFLIIGIALGSFLSLSIKISFIITSIMIGLVGLSSWQKVSIGKFSFFSISVYITMMSIGNLSVVVHDDRNYPSHYTQSSSLNDSFHLLKLKIAKRLKPSQYEHKFEADLINVNGKKICGTLLLNLAKDSLPLNLNVDDVVLVTGKLQDLKGPLNPGQFNYKKYLENRNIYSQLKIDKTSIKGIDSSTDTYKGYAANIRKEINSRLLENKMSPEVLAITNALLLGQREDINPDIYNNYINAGAVHILAVSGLHVGIILLILQFTFRPLNRIKNGKVYKIALILLFLWAFAIIAGLSASVTRAVTMFSVIAIAINLKRANNIYNALAISVFIILLIKPRFLFDVGFQMSYAAVISIVSFGRIFTNLFYFKNKAARYFYDLLCITVAAQIGVLPLSLFYFHQFPALFFISNLLILPILGAILGLGILVIVLALINYLPGLILMSYSFFIELMNSIVMFVSAQESFLFKDISFNMISLIASYILILTFLYFLSLKNFKSVFALIIGIIILQMSTVYNKIDMGNEELVVFHSYRNTAIGKKTNNTFQLFTTIDSVLEKRPSFLKDYRIKNSIREIEIGKLNNFYAFNSNLFVLDRSGIYDINSYDTDILVLSNSPIINLNRVIDSLTPKLIIADGSNYNNLVKVWEKSAAHKKIPFHATAEKGAFVLK